MRFELDDIDWAMGELLELFSRANRRGVMPHEVDTLLFHEAWTCLNAQPFQLRRRCYRILMDKLNEGSPIRGFRYGPRRYEYAFAH